ncbi:hypothetical protein [Arthrobacter sp. GMC3]|uniref:hypothetical protein n=1 Tax=Arthrobacter sp. GMC3 TaxID=2058894 RepID=UPI0011B0833E|nr:hypothetical protein [Arthrobacter sp. GMC3]
MVAPGGKTRFALRSKALPFLACLALVSAATACASPPPSSVGHETFNVATPAVPAVQPSLRAGLPPGMTIAPMPPAPVAPANPGPDDCPGMLSQATPGNETLLCQYFTSGSLQPASVPRGPGIDSGTYAVRFASVGGSAWMTVRIPCAAYLVKVTISGSTITPAPDTIKSVVGTCDFPWNAEQERMARNVLSPLKFEQRPDDIFLGNAGWGITLNRTPYDAD